MLVTDDDWGLGLKGACLKVVDDLGLGDSDDDVGPRVEEGVMRVGPSSSSSSGEVDRAGTIRGDLDRTKLPPFPAGDDPRTPPNPGAVVAAMRCWCEGDFAIEERVVTLFSAVAAGDDRIGPRECRVDDLLVGVRSLPELSSEE